MWLSLHTVSHFLNTSHTSSPLLLRSPLIIDKLALRGDLLCVTDSRWPINTAVRKISMCLPCKQMGAGRLIDMQVWMGSMAFSWQLLSDAGKHKLALLSSFSLSVFMLLNMFHLAPCEKELAHICGGLCQVCDLMKLLVVVWNMWMEFVSLFWQQMLYPPVSFVLVSVRNILRNKKTSFPKR